MNIFLLLCAAIASVFSTAVMSYIAMATPIGPWIAPTLVLLGSLVARLVRSSDAATNRGLALVTAAGSIGGIVATAAAFSYPTLYFLDTPLFISWMAQPLFFCSVLTALVCAAGGCGLLAAQLFEHELLDEYKLPFPIGQLVYKLIAAQNNIRKSYELGVGFLASFCWTVAQGAFGITRAYIPQSFTFFSGASLGVVSIPALSLQLTVLPMLLAIGFIAGHLIAIPLGAGALAKVFIMEPLHAFAFSGISSSDFLLAFCSGMVCAGAVQSFTAVPAMLTSAYASLKNGSIANGSAVANIYIKLKRVETAVALAVTVLFLSYFKFSLLAQVYLILGSVICAYQVAAIAGKIGLAQLGRFATFVMVPALFLFGLDVVQVTLVATFVEICAGVTTDVLFGRKMAQMGQIKRSEIAWFQLFGLIVSAITIGVVFWFLINHFGLGSQDLFAQRAQARALLISVKSFNIYVLLLGALFGVGLKYVHLNPMMVLGGLLMPINYSLSLVLGGMLTCLVKDKESWEPMWSGVFAANSITELIKTLI